ncbi:MAG: DMT family transporter [Kiritimatiellia bacterium]|jgi:drug/metabolite transporter (DMT)-like permease|nr:DMT family transporter [Kiritimatiellia bacterium]MDP6631803.1 DMT family transporter [Kiritimatiellia bacterium]MDP6810440.1 DMT family transporter [Kiritimatiellia bacterium]MDP7024539.1 DMT family transporter [Kiritimatiellia bacterium]
MSDEGHQHRSRTPALFCLLGAICFFSSIPLFLKHFSVHLDMWTVNGVRYSIAALFWLPLVLWRHVTVPESRGVWRAALVPAMANILGQTCWALTPYHSDAAVIGFAIRSSFLFTIAFGMLWVPSERLLACIPAFWLAALFSAAGLLTMYIGAIRSGTGTSVFGLGLIVFTAMLWGLYAVAIRRFLGGYSSRQGFGVVSLYTASALAVAMLLRGDVSALGDIGGANMGLLVLSAFIGIAFAHVMLFTAIHALGPIFCYGVGLIGPFITWSGAALILGEQMSPAQLVGGLILVSGTVGLVYAKRVADGRVV